MTRKSFFCFLATIVILGFGFGSTIYADDPNITDQEISQAVEIEMVHEPALDSRLIDVETNDGVVTLTGTVSNLLMKDRSLEIAEMVKGVRGVVNRIIVSSEARPDAEIRSDLDFAFHSNPVVEPFEIDTLVNGGVVTLTGTVDSWKEKQLAAKAAKGIRGVIDVNNAISVDLPADRPDAELRREVEAALRWDLRVDHELIDVKVSDAEVILSGIVGSAMEKRLAQWNSWVPGVRTVSADDLKVESWARDERFRSSKYVITPDDEVEAAIRAVFAQDPRVTATDFEVDVENGTVTLSGVVGNLITRQAAAEDAANVVGVYRVRNLLRVRPSMVPSDDMILEQVKRKLAVDPYIERYEIRPTVTDGEVSLWGTVDDRFEKRRAATLASQVSGVVDVNNYLEVNRPLEIDILETKSDWEIQQDIRSELFWSPFVDEDEVQVSVDNGTATLTGTVDTLAERNAAQENAFEGGALAVDNDLRVQFGPDYYLPRPE